jgi:hypothetical protein
MAKAASEEAALVISELLANALSSIHREEHIGKALDGDPSGLYIWERVAVLWLRDFCEAHPDFLLGGRSADIVRNADIERYENITNRSGFSRSAKKRCRE